MSISANEINEAMELGIDEVNKRTKYAYSDPKENEKYKRMMDYLETAAIYRITNKHCTTVGRLKEEEGAEIDLLGQFHDYLYNMMDKEGYYPYPAALISGEEGKKRLTMCCLDLKPKQVIRWGIEQRMLEGADEIIYGIDRSTKPGQGTLLNDVLTICHWSKAFGWHYGIIEYCYTSEDNKTVCSYEWNNEFWNKVLKKEVEEVENSIKSLVNAFLQEHNKECAEPAKDRPDDINLKGYEVAFQQEAKDKTTLINEDMLRELCYSGLWLAEKLKELKATDEEIKDARFVAGQRTFLSSPWRAVRKVLGDFAKGLKEKPGKELANKIVMEQLLTGELNPHAIFQAMRKKNEENKDV